LKRENGEQEKLNHLRLEDEGFERLSTEVDFSPPAQDHCLQAVVVYKIRINPPSSDGG
jgi:hypothetical protein